ncbi:MAG: gfo/Idh/MocA family oxidoreductase [Planctomycetota bacterium]|nr:MAG: gfo/Idh/MocA family oxidoreductase [Planctomycetota bacterium]
METRRTFVASGAAVAAGLSGLVERTAAQQGDAPADVKSLVRVGVMGLSRGQSLALDLGGIDGVRVDYLCDVDEHRTNSAARQFQERHGYAPQAVRDFRSILDDDRIDALVCAAPNHWHAPATIMACKAGKHVYVEKPCSHNPQEGEWMIEAANRFKRCVQMGTQRRSAPGTREAIEKLRTGAIGKLHAARCYYNNLRGSIGKGQVTDPPPHLDYDLWQGPVPRRPYRSNVVHYNWHWFWHWGGGELANNGVHALDLCRWGLGVDYPIQTVSSGGRYWFDDDQETPDVQSACFEFAGDKHIGWHALSCNRHGPAYFAVFFGDQGALELDSNGTYRIFDRRDKLVEEGGQSAGGQIEHLHNFVDAIRANDPRLLNQPIEEGHKSTLLCHLGNIAYRTGRTVRTRTEDGHILDDQEQQALWQREYDPAWRDAVTM